jgi:hypothetical protein
LLKKVSSPKRNIPKKSFPKEELLRKKTDPEKALEKSPVQEGFARGFSSPHPKPSGYFETIPLPVKNSAHSTPVKEDGY